MTLYSMGCGAKADNKSCSSSHKSLLSDRSASLRVPLRPRASSEQTTRTPEGGFTCNGRLVSRIRSQIPEGRGCETKDRSCESMRALPAGLGWSPPAARVCRRPFCFSAEIWKMIKQQITLKSKKGTMVEVRYKELHIITGRDLSGALPLVWSLTL